MHRKTDRHGDMQTHKKKDRHTDRHTHTQTKTAIQTCIQTDKAIKCYLLPGLQHVLRWPAHSATLLRATWGHCDCLAQVSSPADLAPLSRRMNWAEHNWSNVRPRKKPLIRLTSGMALKSVKRGNAQNKKLFNLTMRLTMNLAPRHSLWWHTEAYPSEAPCRCSTLG